MESDVVALREGLERRLLLDVRGEDASRLSSSTLLPLWLEEDPRGVAFSEEVNLSPLRSLRPGLSPRAPRSRRGRGRVWVTVPPRESGRHLETERGCSGIW